MTKTNMKTKGALCPHSRRHKKIERGVKPHLHFGPQDKSVSETIIRDAPQILATISREENKVARPKKAIGEVPAYLDEGRSVRNSFGTRSVTSARTVGARRDAGANVTRRRHKFDDSLKGNRFRPAECLLRFRGPLSTAVSRKGPQAKGPRKGGVCEWRRF